METLTGHWDSRDNRDTLIVLCPEMSQRDPSYMAWDNLGQMSRMSRTCPCPSRSYAERNMPRPALVVTNMKSVAFRRPLSRLYGSACA